MVIAGHMLETETLSVARPEDAVPDIPLVLLRIFHGDADPLVPHCQSDSIDQPPDAAEIHDVKGRMVRTLLDEWRDRGSHYLSWNGRDDTGRRVPAGVYFLCIRVHSHNAQQRVLIV